MFTKLHIQNYKSIHDLELELGRVNVFIGENGCGKSNILEAVALLSTAKEGRLRLDDLADKGIRVARPDMMVNAFEELEKEEKNIKISLGSETEEIIEADLHQFRDHYEDFSYNEVLSHWSLIERNSDKREMPDPTKFNIITEITTIKVSTIETIITLYKAILPFSIYEVQTNSLRGFSKDTYTIPGRNGENLDLLLENFTEEQWEQLHKYNKFISWLDEEGIIIDKKNKLRLEGLRLRSNSKLGLRDKFMAADKNIFSIENANEGALHVLFYLALLISDETPPFFAIDNIENALNPYLCRVLTKTLVELSKENGKQSLITTHNPAVLDGLNLHDDEQRLFVVRRNKKGHTVAKRIQLKPDVKSW